ncbi:MAG: RNA 2',3'-cyclic phosphodiesterase [Thermomicrobiales bacterium]|nr:RNA 2',3'-cyclic phosphodiesterase [Thermomicrobiales bacterium]
MTLLDPNDLGSVRAFVGVPLPDAVLDHLAGVQRTIAKASGRAVKWVDPETMHITLEFLGDVPRWVLEDLPLALDEALAGAQPLELETTSVGAFPNWRKPQVVWVGLEGDIRGLRALRDAVAGALRAFGFAADPRPYQPHLTIGRVRPKADRDLVQKLISAGPNVRPGRQSFTIEKVVLYRSILLPDGPEHVALRAWALRRGRT